MIDVLKAKNLSNVIAICDSLSELLQKRKTQYQARFDLVVASFVCAFLPDYGEALRQIKEILKPGGQLVQWDWCSQEESSHPGFTDSEISDALETTGFQVDSVSIGFTMTGSEGEAAVLMAVARK